MTRPLLAVRNLSLRFGGVTALEDVSFDIASGQCVGLIGPNGAGKTSLFNCLTRLYQPSTGSIMFDDRDVLSVRAHEAPGLGITRTFQQVALFESLSVLDNVLVGDHSAVSSNALTSAVRWPAARRAERQARERALAMLQLVGLYDLAGRSTPSLPLPLQKRVELARALVSRPKLLLLDEPASGLTAGEVDELADVLAGLRRQLGLTLLLVEHRLSLVMSLCERIIVLGSGRVLADGEPSVVQSDPVVLASYLGTANGAAGAG